MKTRTPSLFAPRPSSPAPCSWLSFAALAALRHLSSGIWLVVLLLSLPASSQAQSYYTNSYGIWTYTTNASGTNLTITAYSGPSGDVVIPYTINGLPVANIGGNAFAFSTNLSSATIPDSVTNIGPGAFLNCASLGNVTIGSGVTRIEDWAFSECTNLNNVNFRGSAPALGGVNVFHGDIATVYYLPGASGWGATFAGLPAVLWNPPVPYTYTTTNGAITITGYTGSNSMVNIPSSINFLPVTSIGAAALKDRLLGGIYGYSVVIPHSITTIGDSAFYACTGLTNLAIGSNVINIGSAAFQYCQFRNLAIPNSVTNIGDYAFYNSGLANVMTGNGVTHIGNSAFTSCSALTNITMGAAVTSIGNSAFKATGLTRVTIPNSVTIIPNSAFYGCSSLLNVTMSNRLAEIGDLAFSRCFSLASIAIPNSVTNIGGGAFGYCSGLTNVVFGNGVVSIGGGAFNACSKLAGVVIPNNVTSIGQQAFFGCSSLTNATIGNGITAISISAFDSCSSLGRATIPKSVTTVAMSAFYNCSSLTNIFFEGNAPSSVGAFAFPFGSVTIYYLPGTTNWTDPWQGVPTVLWNPQVQTANPAFGVQPAGFGLPIIGTTNIPIVLEAVTDLTGEAWTPLLSGTLTNGSITFTDPDWTNHPARFYRIRSP